MIWLLALFLPSWPALASAPCVFPERAEVLFAEAVSDHNIALVEKHSLCLYVIAPQEPKVLWSLPLEGPPSDIKYLRSEQKIFLYFPQSATLKSIHLPTQALAIETSLPPGETCAESTEQGIKIESCRPFPNRAFKILAGETEIFLSSGSLLLALPLSGPPQVRVLPLSFLFFSQRILLHPATGRLLLLSNFPSGESTVHWKLLTSAGTLVSPLPNLALWGIGLKEIYFLPGGDFFLIDTGQIYRVRDFSYVATLGQELEKAFFVDEKIVSLRQEENLYKATVFNQNLRPISFEYFFQSPLLIAPANPGSLLYVFSQGTLSELFQTLPLRNL